MDGYLHCKRMSMGNTSAKPSRAQISRAAIRRMHIEMRHLIMRGQYKPLGRSGEEMIKALLDINPEIYGSIADPERVELTGFLYVFQRLPKGIAECRHVKLISREGYEDSTFDAIIPSKRRRNCFRIDEEQMYIEMTRGRSDIYDVLTHLTFLYNEAEKIGRNALQGRGQPGRTWRMLKKIVQKIDKGEEFDRQVAISYLSTMLGRTFDETAAACDLFDNSSGVNDLFTICYHLGKNSIEETIDKNDREISFSSSLRQLIGLHTYGESWATNVKRCLQSAGLLNRPIHIISANMHSVMNTLYAQEALDSKEDLSFIANQLSKSVNKEMRQSVRDYASKNGMIEVHDHSGTNISVQVIDLSKIKQSGSNNDHVIVVMDYAFGQQAYETMDELLKPLESGEERIKLNIHSVNIMGKAGILCGDKGDIMIPSAHIFEGSTDNYPFKNALNLEDFHGSSLKVYAGPMITVLGTSLQNKDVLSYFLKSSWQAIGLEMEGAHYQKAIQVASQIRHSISPEVVLRYAYYASDNPLESGSTLASGSLGEEGVKPTYTITELILEGIFAQA